MRIILYHAIYMEKTMLLQINNLKKYFKIGNNRKGPIYLRAVDGVSLEVDEGQTLGLVGESGSGKSTLAYTVIGMYRATAGEILFKGQSIGVESSKRPLALKKEMQIVFQDPGSSLNPRQSVSKLISLNLRLHRNLNGAALQSAIIDLLKRVELSADYMSKTATSMGGGEKQMVAIARALASDPSLVILDEPTSALDVSVQAKIINKLITLQKDYHLTYLFITHDLSIIRNVADKIAILYLGKVCELASAVEFFQNPIHPYTQMLLSSVPVISEEEERLKPRQFISTGEIPSPVNIPPGCSFHSRCKERVELCNKEDPVMIEIHPGHFVRCHLFQKNQQ
jgi:peptide/nickel transport system ATP-binding protein